MNHTRTHNTSSALLTASQNNPRHITFSGPRRATRRAGVGLCALLVGLAVILGSASLVHAATPVLIGAGNNASVAVDGAGTAFIVYNDNDDNPTTAAPDAVVHFCRLPRGATACAHTLDFALAGTSLERPFVFLEGQMVRILASRYNVPGAHFDVTFVLTSTDGGSTFGPPVRAGTAKVSDAVAGPGTDGISIVHGHQYQRVSANTPFPFDQNGRSTLGLAAFGDEYFYGAAVALVNATTPLVTSNALNGTAAFRVFNGSGDVNDAANWSAPQVIAREGGYGQLAQGPSGLFSQLAASNPGRLDVRRFDGATFGAPTSIPIAEGAPWNHLAQDPGGMLFSLWPENSGVVGPRLRYASSPDGTAWRRAELAAFPHPVYNLRAAAAADHLGYAVMQVDQPEGKQIYAVPLAPAPAVTPPPPAIARPPAASAPSVSGSSLTRRVFCVGRACPRARRGTVLRFVLSAPAGVVFSVERQVGGRRVNGRCRRVARDNRGARRCSRYVSAGSFRKLLAAGPNSVAFSGRIGGRALRPGSYRQSLTAFGASGARSASVRVRFRISRPGPARAGSGR